MTAAPGADVATERAEHRRGNGAEDGIDRVGHPELVVQLLHRRLTGIPWTRG